MESLPTWTMFWAIWQILTNISNKNLKIYVLRQNYIRNQQKYLENPQIFGINKLVLRSKKKSQENLKNNLV